MHHRRPQVIALNRREVRGYFDSRILSPGQLQQAAQAFHADDALLIQKHYAVVKQQHYIERLKKNALSPTYAGRLARDSSSRGLSTRSLENQQARQRSVRAEAKYQRVAITATLDQAKAAKGGRRSSCVSFLLS